MRVSEIRVNQIRVNQGLGVYFSDEVFSLGMPLVCPHLTTVHDLDYRKKKK